MNSKINGKDVVIENDNISVEGINIKTKKDPYNKQGYDAAIYVTNKDEYIKLQYITIYEQQIDPITVTAHYFPCEFCGQNIGQNTDKKFNMLFLNSNYWLSMCTTCFTQWKIDHQ